MKQKKNGVDRERGRQFGAWLVKHGFTSESFARESGVSVYSVAKWREGRKPGRFVCQTLRDRFSDCPLFAAA